MIKGIDRSSKLALLGNSIMVIRRIIFLYVAMYKHENPLTQILCFQILSLLSLVYLGYSKPYQRPRENELHCWNEFATLSVSYFVLILNGMNYSIQTTESVSLMINFLILLVFLINGLLIVLILTFQFHHWLLRRYSKKCRKHNCLLKFLCCIKF